MSKKQLSKSARELIVDSLKLPRDMAMGACIVTALGNEQVMVENYRGILEYTQNSIVLQSKTCRIAVCGCGLKIAYYTNEDMKIEGKISEIRYL
ncbi:MAG TPA: YabP/YqfC family sporulation protein [Candidatus Eisenbergiella merdigallinarum]|uniref:YabP/YqfC family sporulation protein n=1 Tax=Candidatus Eisenbergiella merdigallinarum TaxID=2838552 RepID=A0A9D2MP86_9FIRM|nr:YabP/YqfC family sporulation protein [Candidatus Eisenbergiella merdigallinarum]